MPLPLPTDPESADDPDLTHSLGSDLTRAAATTALHDDDPLDPCARHGSLLESIATRIGPVPHVLLRETGPGESPSPTVRSDPGAADATLRYRIDGEIARGGMGAVLKGHDPDLGRDVAIKVLREDLRNNTGLIRRFVEEAQIGGQLQHPGIVPIYELGEFTDQRPFFAMRLVKGQTLADLLAARSAPADDLSRFLAIFAAVAQTMAYAHTRGVIHRDLKPANIMVGSFGEVQVMDWGLAKVLPRAGTAARATPDRDPEAGTIVATSRSEADANLSQIGSVLGTPSSMPPEQAQGEIDRVDERADVFALGSILAEILTGKPAFTGRSTQLILLKAARGDTAEALDRLDASGAEAELVALVTACLAREPADRPRNATVVAERITGYQAGVQERVQTATRERAVAEAQAVEERKRRRLQLGLAAAVIAIMTMGGVGVLYRMQRHTAEATTLVRVVGEVSTLLDVARDDPGDLGAWHAAAIAVKQAEGVADDIPEVLVRLRPLRAEIEAGAHAAERDRDLIGRLENVRLEMTADRVAETTAHDVARVDAAFLEAFRAGGLDFTKLSAADAADRIKAHTPDVARKLTAAIDYWAAYLVFATPPAGHEPGNLRWVCSDRVPLLAAVARRVDPDPVRSRLRTMLLERDDRAQQEALRALAHPDNFPDLGAVGLTILGKSSLHFGDPTLAVRVLRQAQLLHPANVWVQFEFAQVLNHDLHRPAESIRYYTAARALRLDTGHDLGVILLEQGSHDEATKILQDVVRLRPGDVAARLSLGAALARQGDDAGSLREIREARDLRSKQPNGGPPLDDRVAEAERRVALHDRLPALAAGTDHVSDNADRLVLGRMCRDTGRYAAAARFLAEALDAAPGLGDDLHAGHRRLAAGAAVRAGLGQGRDEPAPDGADRTRLREQALAWLRADLAAWGRVLDRDADPLQAEARATLARWKTDPDLAGVRDAESLDHLPEPERAAWRAYWAELDATLRRSGVMGA